MCLLCSGRLKWEDRYYQRNLHGEELRVWIFSGRRAAFLQESKALLCTVTGDGSPPPGTLPQGCAVSTTRSLLRALAAMHHSSPQATWQTSSGVSRGMGWEGGWCSYCTTHTHTPCPIHSGPSRSGAPLLTDTLSSCTVSPGLPQSQTSTPHVKHALADAYRRTNMTRKLKEWITHAFIVQMWDQFILFFYLHAYCMQIAVTIRMDSHIHLNDAP